MNCERYSRQTMLPEIGPDGQRRLTKARVAVIGVGGLGSAVSTYLAGAGTGTILLADPDVVSLSNLQRQVLYSETEVGLPKTECAARRLRALNSEISVEEWSDGLTAENGRSLLAGCDVVVDCTDNFSTRYLIDDICAELGIPWVYGSIGEFAGQVSVFNHHNRIRYSNLYPDREALCSLPRKTLGVLGAVPGVVGAIQACEAIKLLTGAGELLDGRLLSIDLLTMQFQIFKL